MATARINDVELFYEQTGEGTPLVFLHEFAGDYRSWETQVRFFARRNAVVTFNARGYPPSEVPEDFARLPGIQCTIPRQLRQGARQHHAGRAAQATVGRTKGLTRSRGPVPM